MARPWLPGLDSCVMEESRSLPAHEPAGKSPASRASPPRRILVVDDDISARRLDTAVLIHHGYKVDVAEDGAAAWQALNTDRYDLVITDNDMPKVTGVELLRKLRAACMAQPVIMASGTLPKEEFTLAPWLQPDATLPKPFTIAALLEAVQKLLREAEGSADCSLLTMCRDRQNNRTSQERESARATRQCEPVPCTHNLAGTECTPERIQPPIFDFLERNHIK